MNTFTPSRKYLVFSSVDNSRSAYDQWLSDGERNFDVALYVYKGELSDERVDIIKYREGFKFENFFDFSQHYDVLQYDAVWIVDDDIQLRTPDINQMFDMFSRHKLWIGQPAYSNDSYTPMQLCFVDEGYHLRYSNFCENGVSIFSSEALRKCLPVMKDIKTGWGSEYLFYKLIGSPDKGVAILDDVVCFHPRHESSLDLLIPRSFHASEVFNLIDKHDYKIYAPRILGGERRVENNCA